MLESIFETQEELWPILTFYYHFIMFTGKYTNINLYKWKYQNVEQ